MTPYLLPTLLLASILTGCVGGAAEASPGDPTLQAELRPQRSLRVVPAESDVRVDVASHRTGPTRRQSIPIASGTVDLRALSDGTVWLDGLRLTGEDVRIGADLLPPTGLTLVDVSLGLEEPVALEGSWIEGQSAFAGEATVTLTLEWSLASRTEEPIELGTRPLSQTRLELLVHRRNGAVTAEVIASRRGELVRLGELAEARDLSFELVAMGASSPE